MSDAVVRGSFIPTSARGERGVATAMSTTAVLATLLAFLYWVAFENVVFFFAADVGMGFWLFTNVIKLSLPLALLAYAGLPPTRMLVQGPVSLYLALFAAFLGWALVPTLISGDATAYLKFLPRLVFFVGLVSLFSTRPAAVTLFAKLVVVYVLCALAQWVLLYATAGYDRAVVTPFATFAGPFGLLGNISGRFYLPGISVPIVRLAGFWNEPSNAAGSAYASFFLARYLYQHTGKRHWRWASFGSLLAGVLTFSNAGYLALGAGLIVGMVLGTSRLTVRSALRFGVIVPLGVLLIFTALLGRQFVAANLYGSVWARAFSGVRGDDPTADLTSGRVDLAKSTLGSARSTLIGNGIQTWGEGGIIASSSAPLLWLALTGIPGFLLLAGREATLWVGARAAVARDAWTLPLVQALAVVMTQQLSYGSWMDANYFWLAAAVLAVGARTGSNDGSRRTGAASA